MTTMPLEAPPPPPAAPPKSGFDFARSFTFVFDDPDWLQKTLIGGLFVFAGFFLFGWIFLFGYMAVLVRNVIAGVERPLPDWSRLGDYFTEGLKLFALSVVYFLPVMLVGLVVFLPLAILSNHGNDAAEVVLMTVGICFMVPLVLIIVAILPAAMLRVIAQGRFGAGFEFGPIFRFIRENLANYLLAVVTYLVARMLSGFGVILCCVGVVFTVFLATAMTFYAFGQAYKHQR